MIIKYKRVVSVLVVAAILVLPLAFSVSFAKWTGGASSINVEDVQVGDFYVELTRSTDSERQPVLVRSFTVDNSANIRNYVCVKSIVPDDVELDATNVLAGTLYFECVLNGNGQNQTLKSIVVTASATDAQGKITGNGGNDNTSDLPNVTGNSDSRVTLESVAGTDGAIVNVAFGKGAQQYVALDYNIVLSKATSCTINVYFIQSPDKYFTGTDGAAAIDPETGAHEEINSDTWSSAFAEGFGNGLGMWLRGDIGTTEITVKAGMVYKFYFESSEVTSVDATDTPSRGSLFGGRYTNLYSNFEYKANADGNGNGGWVLKAGSGLDGDTIRVKFELKNGVLVGGYK